MARGGLGWVSSSAIAYQRYIKTSGPLPLARGGLGWGPPWAIATSRTHERRSHLYSDWRNLFLHDVAIAPIRELSSHSFFLTCGKRKLSRRESRIKKTPP
ncbi:hypothetical protein [Laspinema olomoucense]|uniref:hypothetical protein n=1 Tax=Laspinema olomoucense TaxID=3231600 RepID=UPI0021BB9FC4|nr:hypothetical protein [Laspinema sp. D3c]MCT7992844.1 hypothetical protein [Laspinema sp. D3c]